MYAILPIIVRGCPVVMCDSLFCAGNILNKSRCLRLREKENSLQLIFSWKIFCIDIKNVFKLVWKIG